MTNLIQVQTIQANVFYKERKNEKKTRKICEGNNNNAKSKAEHTQTGCV